MSCIELRVGQGRSWDFCMLRERMMPSTKEAGLMGLMLPCYEGGRA